MIRAGKRGQQTLKHVVRTWFRLRLACSRSREYQNIFIFPTRLKDCAVQKLQSDINSSPKANYYKHFKSMLKPERYIFINLPFQYKKHCRTFKHRGTNLK